MSITYFDRRDLANWLMAVSTATNDAANMSGDMRYLAGARSVVVQLALMAGISPGLVWPEQQERPRELRAR